MIYYIQWLGDNGEMKVSHMVHVNFEIGPYKDSIEFENEDLVFIWVATHPLITVAFFPPSLDSSNDSRPFNGSNRCGNLAPPFSIGIHAPSHSTPHLILSLSLSSIHP
jgi:hypothetical protein